MGPRIDLLGQRFGRLVVVSDATPMVYPYGSFRRVRVRCDCGGEMDVLANSLLRGKTKSCPHCRVTRKLSERIAVGQRFGRLVVTGSPDYRVVRKYPVPFFPVRCDCGTQTVVNGYYLHLGDTTSCGCYRAERVAEGLALKHGEANKPTAPIATPEYRAWRGMINRCYQPSSERFSRYGGRGIVVCDRWHHSFENFLADMGRKPSPKHSIDRIDNDGNYEPGNCRWATASEQQRNKSRRKKARSEGGQIK
jgi:hypothetical protein